MEHNNERLLGGLEESVFDVLVNDVYGISKTNHTIHAIKSVPTCPLFCVTKRKPFVCASSVPSVLRPPKFGLMLKRGSLAVLGRGRNVRGGRRWTGVCGARICPARSLDVQVIRDPSMCGGGTKTALWALRAAPECPGLN